MTKRVKYLLVSAQTRMRQGECGERPRGGICRQRTGGGRTEWIDSLLTILGSMDPAAFERLCQRLLREAGFIKVEVTGRSGDGKSTESVFSE